MTAAVVTTPASSSRESPADLLLRRIWFYAAVPRSAGAARRDVASRLARWGLDTLTDMAALVTSELVTNALASSQAARQQGDDDLTSRIALCLTYGYQDLIIEVWDGGTGHPVRRTPGRDAETGRGLDLAASPTDNADYYQAHVRTPTGRLQKARSSGLSCATTPHPSDSSWTPLPETCRGAPRPESRRPQIRWMSSTSNSCDACATACAGWTDGRPTRPGLLPRVHPTDLEREVTHA